jgi:predicted nuclease of predicted toxin-antitoxin system
MALAPIPFFTDENVPDSVGWSIQGAGHELTRLREYLVTGSKDELIAISCARAGHVLVSHDNDFKALAERLQLAKLSKTLHRVDMKCYEPEGARRIREAMSLIEHEWMHARVLKVPMLVTIGNDYIRVRR